jgi:hypothetical protein
VLLHLIREWGVTDQVMAEDTAPAGAYRTLLLAHPVLELGPTEAEIWRRRWKGGYRARMCCSMRMRTMLSRTRMRERGQMWRRMEGDDVDGRSKHYTCVLVPRMSVSTDTETMYLQFVA